MPSYNDSNIWKKYLALRTSDPHEQAREQLRAAYEGLRKHVKPLAEAIAKDLPEYTVHDITHSDALWECAEIIIGSEYPLNPAEAFVLGCSFLIHDLGMGLVTYPEGKTGIKKLDIWKDVVAGFLRKNSDDEVLDEKIANPGEEIEKLALTEVLRRLHAEHANELTTRSWKAENTDAEFYLIENTELRDAYGNIIGKIAASHCQPLEKIYKEFQSPIGAYRGFPQEWTVDPLKLACILRAADCAHIDANRAPSFLRLLRAPQNISQDHWIFQNRLTKVQLDNDRLKFTSNRDFTVKETAAWWLCFDTLKKIDKELRQIGALLADTGREKFIACSVSHIDDASRLTELIRVTGWIPVDTQIRVSAVADLVSKLGGKELYGDTVVPPLRELIQNAADAVRARRLTQDYAADWGKIRVITGKDDSGTWIQVEDNGIGMNKDVLTGPFLDFGTSFWNTPLMHEQLPGLAAKKFQPTGRYGIGFFSVFMWGEHVEVTTRRFDEALNETKVLVFEKGLKERPLLRKASKEEYIKDCGTSVKVWLSDPKILSQLLSTFEKDEVLTLTQVCAKLAPCLDVTLEAMETNGNIEVAVKANDWLSITSIDLLKRLDPRNVFIEKNKLKIPPLQLLKNSNDTVIGRVAIGKYLDDTTTILNTGCVVVGGLTANDLHGLIGVLTGKVHTASRDMATPIIPLEILRQWAESERVARLTEKASLDELRHLANILCVFGMEPKGLPIATTKKGELTFEEVAQHATKFNEIFLGSSYYDIAQNYKQIKEKVFVCESGFSLILDDRFYIYNRRNMRLWPDLGTEIDHWGEHQSLALTLEGALIKALALGWNCSIEEILKCSSFHLDFENLPPNIQDQKIMTDDDGKKILWSIDIIRRPST